ncbi:hypothetical protein C8Q75DRAFT_816082, partial [Abortiporus biennis]
EWLDQCGYLLRPRYRPNWEPSWSIDEYPWSHEDSVFTVRAQIMDATRKSDGRVVALKHVLNQRNPFEIEITESLSTGDQALDPRNHAVPLFEILSIPNADESILVFPLLHTCYDPPLETVGEFVDFMKQVIEGVQFLHEYHIAHRDIMLLNTMMDPGPLYPEPYHPQATIMSRDLDRRVTPFSRTEKPTRYYIIDFGISRHYPSYVTAPLELPIEGGIKTVPEFQGPLGDIPCNPFPTDIYYLGCMINQVSLQNHRGLKFIRPLVNDMMKEEPAHRPTIEEVVDRFAIIQRSLRWWQLRSRMVSVDEGLFEYLHQSARHIYRTCDYIAKGYKAIPTPPEDGRLSICRYLSSPESTSTS